MYKIHEVSKLAGVSKRTLQYYDKIGLLSPTEKTNKSYRMYGKKDLERLQEIMLLKELEFPLQKIKSILSSQDNSLVFENDSPFLEEQIGLLEKKKHHFENLITFARALQRKEDKTMDFSAFNDDKIKQYSKIAKEKWQDTASYQEYEQKAKKRTIDMEKNLGKGLMIIFEDFGKIKDQNPSSFEASTLVAKLQQYLTENYYTCTKEILATLGEMYDASPEFTSSIDQAGGVGTTKFVKQAIDAFCK
jgi:DNA-binding transcriptional MerR regulator